MKIKNVSFFVNAIMPWLYYDIFTDFVIILDNTSLSERPLWYSTLIASGMVCYAIKTYSIISTCSLLITCNYKKNFTLLRKSTFFLFVIGILYMAYNMYLIYTYHIFQYRISVKLFNEYTIYFIRFVLIYQLIIILIAFTYIIKTFIEKKIPKKLEETLKIFFYLGVIPQVFIENLQTSTFQFIAFLFGQGALPYYSLLTTQITGSLSLVFFFILLITLKSLSSLLETKKHILQNELYLKDERDQEEQNNPKMYFYLNHSIFDNIDDIEFPINYVLVTSVKSTLGKILETPTELIHVELNEITMMLIAKINSIKILHNHLKKYGYIIIDDLETYLFFNNNDLVIREVHYIMNELNLRIIIPWKLTEQDTHYIGALVIEKNFSYNSLIINDSIFSTLLKITVYVKKFQNIIQQRSIQSLIVFKISLLHEHLSRIKKLQKETIKNVLIIMQKISIGMYIKNKKKETWVNALIAEKNTIRKFYDNQSKEIFLIERDYKNTLLLQNAHDGKKDVTFFASIPIHDSLKDSTHDEIMLQLSEIGRTINDIMPGNIDSFIAHKNDVLEYIRNPQPYLFINQEEQYIHNFFLLIAFITKKKIIHCDCLNSNISPLAFFKNAISNEHNKLIIFYNVHMANIFEQKNIIKFYIENQQHDITFSNKIFFVTNYQENISILDDYLLQIVISKEFNPPLIEMFKGDNEAVIELINSFSLNLRNMTLPRDIMNNLISTLAPWQSIYFLIEFIMKYNNELSPQETTPTNHLEKDENRSEIDMDALTKEAILLARKALHNKNLMFALLKKYNMSEIATMLGVHKSTITRYYKSNDMQKNIKKNV